jgi:hypothetical protein
MLVQVVVGVGAAVALWAVYYFLGPGYEKHLCKDEPQINPQHTEETKLALQLVRAYAKANGYIAEYEKIITTPEGGFDAWIGELQSFAYAPGKGLSVKTIVDAQLHPDVTTELAQFSGNALLLGGALAFVKNDTGDVLVLVNTITNLSGKKTAFVKSTTEYAKAAKAFDVLLLQMLQQKSTGQTQ